MKLVICNGSPKPGNNNTEILVNHFIKGFEQNNGNTSEIHKLNKLNGKVDISDIFNSSEYLLLAFPLYSYSMPAGVKEFIEKLEPFCGNCADKKIGFIVQYGFPEATHARPLEKYLEHLCKRLGCQYLGTIIKGGCDGLTRSPRNYGKTLRDIQEIGRQFATTGQFDKTLLLNFSRPEKQGLVLKLMMRVVVHLINRFYWGATLKKNGMYDKSFARPYA